MELRNRLQATTGLRIPATVVFDYPSSRVLADFLFAEVSGTDVDAAHIASSVAVHAGADDDPVAIIGMACRYPGGVTDAEGLWQLVVDGVDGVTADPPTDRGWDLGRLYDPELSRPETTYVLDGGFLYDAADFDPDFFGISPREAHRLDPQLRVLLEASWEAFERAGIAPGTLKGSPTGVYAGLMHHDYVTSAIQGSTISGRVSYTLGLEGPSVTVDTACSSSLVALHFAARRCARRMLAGPGGRRLRHGDPRHVHRIQPPGRAVPGRPLQGVLGRRRRYELGRGRRRPRPGTTLRRTAQRPPGTGRGPGLGGEPGRRFQRLHTTPTALAATSHPQGSGYRRSRRRGHRRRGSPRHRYVLGPDREAQALLATYGQGRPEGRPLWLGSLKSNLGHTQAASGVASVIKMVMAMRHGVLPRTLHVDEPSPHVDWSAGAVELLTEAREWESDGRPRRRVSRPSA